MLRTFNIEFHNFLGTRGHHPHLLLVHLGEVGDIADLGERLHPLELVRHVQVGPSFTKIGEGGASVLVVRKLPTFFCKLLVERQTSNSSNWSMRTAQIIVPVLPFPPLQ